MTRGDIFGPEDADVDAVGEYDVRSPLARTLLTVAASVVVIGALIGILIAVSHLTTSERTETETISLDGLAQVTIDAGSADVTVRQGEGTDLEVTARVVEGIVGTDYELVLVDDVVVASSACRSWVVPGCGVELAIEVPLDYPVVVRTTTGDITFGEVHGVVTARSGSGHIVADGATVLELDVASGSGDIDVVFASQPFGFKARTQSGDIAAVIPDGDIEYAITIETQSGEVDSAIDDSAAADGFVTVETDSGDIILARS